MFNLQISNVDIYFKVFKMAMQLQQSLAVVARAAAYCQSCNCGSPVKRETKQLGHGTQQLQSGKSDYKWTTRGNLHSAAPHISVQVYLLSVLTEGQKEQAVLCN